MSHVAACSSLGGMGPMRSEGRDSGGWEPDRASSAGYALLCGVLLQQPCCCSGW